MFLPKAQLQVHQPRRFPAGLSMHAFISCAFIICAVCCLPQIVGYLKLAHLVSFSMLLDVTSVSAAAALGALSADGRRGGLLVRGNWAARAEDAWRGGASQAIDCLSVAQCLLHRYFIGRRGYRGVERRRKIAATTIAGTVQCVS